MAGMELGEDFPLVCESCLGPNPYVRMVKTVNGTECKISKRPCTMFEWRSNGVKKQTCVAYAVAAQKNICQCCMTDLTFGLPVGVRDAFMKKAMEKGIQGVTETFGTLPQSRVGQDYYFNQLEDAKASAQAGTLLLKDDSTEALTGLMKGAVAHTQSFGDGFNFKLPPICAGWVKGSCKHKKSCAKRPCCGMFKFPELSQRQSEQLEKDLKEKGPENVQPDDNTRRRLLEVIEHSKEEEIRRGDKSDKSDNKTLFVHKLGPEVTDADVKATFSKFGGVQRVSVVESGNGKIAFIEFDKKESAEFVLSLSGLTVGRSPVEMSWARPKLSDSLPTSHGKYHTSERNDRDVRRPKPDQPEQNKRPRRDEESGSRSNPSTHKEPPALSKASQSAVPQAVLAALKMRKAKGLDDDD